MAPRPSAKENTILTGSGTIRDPKNGEATKNAPTLKEARNKQSKKTTMLWNSNPGKTSDCNIQSPFIAISSKIKVKYSVNVLSVYGAKIAIAPNTTNNFGTKLSVIS